MPEEDIIGPAGPLPLLKNLENSLLQASSNEEKLTILERFRQLQNTYGEKYSATFKNLLPAQIVVGEKQYSYPSFKAFQKEINEPITRARGTFPPSPPGGTLPPKLPPTPPPQLPSSLDPTGARGMNLDQFERMLRAELQSSAQGYTMHATKMPEGFLRVGIRAPGSKDTLSLDMRPGPLTTFGDSSIPSIERVSPSGYNRILGSEAYLPKEGSPQLRNPLRNFTEYLRAAQSQGIEFLAGAKATFNERFSTVISSGWEDEKIGVAGALQTYGPLTPQIARE